MSKIRIHRNHDLGRARAREAAEHAAAIIAEKYGIQCEWRGDALEFGGSGVTGAMDVTEHDVTIQVKLGMLLGMLKTTIESEINRQLDEHFS